MKSKEQLDSEISDLLFRQRLQKTQVKVKRRFKGQPERVTMSIYIRALGFYGAPIKSDIDDFDRWESRNRKKLQKFNVEFKGIGTEWQNQVIMIPESEKIIERDGNTRLEPLKTNESNPLWESRIQDFANAAGIEVGSCDWYVSLDEY